jgi:hypothetical protein
VRGQILDDLQAKSGSMGQKAAEIWTAQADSQTGRAKSDRLLGCGMGWSASATPPRRTLLTIGSLLAFLLGACRALTGWAHSEGPGPGADRQYCCWHSRCFLGRLAAAATWLPHWRPERSDLVSPVPCPEDMSDRSRPAFFRSPGALPAPVRSASRWMLVTCGTLCVDAVDYSRYRRSSKISRHQRARSRGCALQ